MRRHSKILSKLFFKGMLMCAVVFVGGLPAFSQTNNKNKKENTELQRDARLEELTFTQMVNSVEVDPKSADLIRQFQEKEGRNRLNTKDNKTRHGYTVETMRNKEVLVVSIPASKLFGPNEVELRDDVSAVLSTFKRYMKGDDMYRVALVMHTDNTGNEEYREHLTEQRASAIFDWFNDQGVNTNHVFAYAFGDDDPLVENNSMQNRAKNRRLEIYLIPGKKMVEQAKKGRIVL